MTVTMPETSHEPPTDEQLRQRTRELLRAAESISVELIVQTERLAAAIAIFRAEFVEPLRRELNNDDGYPGTSGT